VGSKTLFNDFELTFRSYGIIFFGTPQTGPGNNPEARLGMACVKIARSLPGIQSPNLIETLERGSLFSDFLREAFRHQLEAYKVVSCYEGIGDVCPVMPAETILTETPY
jgi:hypothetical protein